MQSSSRAALYPGTFDPITNGHVDLISRAVIFFDRLYIGVAQNSEKSPLFSADQRVGLVEAALQERLAASASSRVEIVSFGGLLTHLARSLNVRVILRGLRAVSDFEYEFQMASMNAVLDPSLETVFLMAGERSHFVSSRLVKEIAALGGDITPFVPACVATAMTHKTLKKAVERRD